MANVITVIRVICSIALLLCQFPSPAFYILYVTAGITDIIDGAVARKTDTVSEFGAKLDTAADFVFVVVCLIKLIPLLDIPKWLYAWIAVIALVIFICFLDICLEHSGIGFEKKIYSDNGEDKEFVLNAKYRLD